MAVHILVLQQSANPTTLQKLEVAYPTKYKIANNVWAIKSAQTSKEISDALSLSELKVTHVVFKISAWWGLYQREFWEWVDTASKD